MRGYSPRLPARMAIDDRIPTVTGSGAGHCSKVTFEVLDPSQITGLNQLDYLPGNPPPNGTTTDPQGRIFLLKQGTFPTGIDYAGGQVKIDRRDSTICCKICWRCSFLYGCSR